MNEPHLRAAAMLWAALLASGCNRGVAPPAEAQPAFTLDLAARAFVADQSRALLFLGTPAGAAASVSGVLAAQAEDGTPSAWLQSRAVLRLPPADGARAAILDLAPAPGLLDRDVQVFAGGRRIRRFRLEDGRRAYRLDLPADVPARSLRLQFGPTTASQPAARAYGLLVTAPDDPLADALARPGARPLLELQRKDERTRLVQHGNGALRFALALPAGAALHFTPFLESASGAATLCASVRLEGDSAERRLWCERLAPGREGPPQRLPLPGPSGALALVEVSLQADGAEVPSGGFLDLRLSGAGAPPVLLERPAPFAPLDEQRADELRRGLAGVNVVLVILDAARAQSFGCYGHARRTTPEVDRLAAEGVLFERAQTPAVLTLAAMPSLWTSLYPDAHHAGVPQDDPLPLDKPTLAELLARGSIRSAGFVANTNAGASRGLARGFDEFHEVHIEQRSIRAEAFDRVLPRWLDAHRDRRFFLYVHYREPHFPYDPPAPFDTLFGPDRPLGRKERAQREWKGAVNSGALVPSAEEIDHLRRLYDGNLAYVDAQVGVLRRRLEERGLLERTVLIVTADHGETLYEHGAIGHNVQLYEESLRIPLVMRLPAAAAAAGRRSRAGVDLVDLAPTVLDLLGLPAAAEAASGFEGRSLLPVALGAPGRPALLSFSEAPRAGVALRHGAFKYLRLPGSGDERLFDTERDPLEREDLLARSPVRAAYYRQELSRRLLGRGDVARSTSPPALTREQVESLKALGYVQ